jgi:two-component system response regulator AtoC
MLRETETMEKTTILVVDDEEGMRDSLRDWLDEDGYHVVTASSGAEAIQRVQQHTWDLMLVDLKMPGMDGLEVLKNAKAIKPEIPVIILTAYATVDTSVQAMKQGAHDYIVKPIDPEELSLTIEKLMEQQRLRKENRLLRKQLMKDFRFQDMIGKSPAMQELFRLLTVLAPTSSTTLIQGESGTGKELAARAIHNCSPRRGKPFVALPCGALSESLLESELFGYEKGAFTGATARRKGKLELADKGTLFLDDVAQAGMKFQVDLLRFLQQREFLRVGGSEPVQVDVRVIAASNKDLRDEVANGSFREDLLYRLNVVMVSLPPLRKRKEDIPLLVDHFISCFNAQCNKNIREIAPSALRMLLEHPWPGNVRELENVIEHAAIVCETAIIRPGDLGIERAGRANASSTRTLRSVEKEHIRRVLQELDWNMSAVARTLGIHRATLYKKVRQYGLAPDEGSSIPEGG